MNDFNCIIESYPDENSINFIKDELNKYNQMFAEPDNHKLLAVFIKDTDKMVMKLCLN
jgi:phage tail sheath gpL-like